MKHRKLIAVLMMALCLIGTMPLSVSANKTLFVLGDQYRYNDVKFIESAYVDPNVEQFPIEVEGSLAPIDLTLIDDQGIEIGSIDIISANIDNILGGRLLSTTAEDDDSQTIDIDTLEIEFTGDVIFYSSALGYDFPTFINDATFWLNFAHLEYNYVIDGEPYFYFEDINQIIIDDGTSYHEILILKPKITIVIDNIIENSPQNVDAISDILAAFLPIKPFQTQLTYTFDGFSTMASNAFEFIHSYVVINNPIIFIALCIMAVVLCLIILKFIFDRRY